MVRSSTWLTLLPFQLHCSFQPFRRRPLNVGNTYPQKNEGWGFWCYFGKRSSQISQQWRIGRNNFVQSGNKWCFGKHLSSPQETQPRRNKWKLEDWLPLETASFQLLFWFHRVFSSSGVYYLGDATTLTLSTWSKGARLNAWEFPILSRFIGRH